MTARKLFEITMGVVAVLHPGFGPMKPDEIYARQEEMRIAESTRYLDQETQTRVGGRYVTVESRPFEVNDLAPERAHDRELPQPDLARDRELPARTRKNPARPRQR